MMTKETYQNLDAISYGIVMSKDNQYRLKIDRFMRRRFFWKYRFPFNTFYFVLMLGTIVGSLYWWYTSGDTKFPLAFATLFVALLTAFSICTVIYFIRWFHTDSTFMYKRRDTTYLSDEGIRNRYLLMVSASYAKASVSISYKDIVGLTVFHDSSSDLLVLFIEAKRTVKAFESDSISNDETVYSAGVWNQLIDEPPAKKYFPLYYKENEAFLQFLAEKTGLKIMAQKINIRKLREKTEKFPR
ncbi:MAG: hypothetical protein GX684_03905 [Ruminococcaceae bacterium]|nr:hypothetical protein [Oscillospiraceae bacterium]